MIVLADSAGTARTLTIVLFLVLVAVTLGITFWASRQTRDARDFYAGGRSFSGFQNGLAIGGDYMSAASFLGIAGIIALSGYASTHGADWGTVAALSALIAAIGLAMALLVGGALWGVIGAVLAIPTAAIISVIIEEFAHRYPRDAE